ncbi:MAG TPA: FtsX-like permease family protein [Vicinamibacterales bacterium]|nr:FtsX-like permease family protein [Vicinamibacterales bacterium]
MSVERHERSAARAGIKAAALGEHLGFWSRSLAFVGLHGVVSYAVARRKREFGVRLTLGARPSDVRAMVLREGLVLAAIGSRAGVAVAVIAAGISEAAWAGARAESVGPYAAGAAARGDASPAECSWRFTRAARPSDHG